MFLSALHYAQMHSLFIVYIVLHQDWWGVPAQDEVVPSKRNAGLQSCIIGLARKDLWAFKRPDITFSYSDLRFACVSTSEAWDVKPLFVIKSIVNFPAEYANWLASFFISYEQTYLIYLGHSCQVSFSLYLLFTLVEYFDSEDSHYVNWSTQQLPYLHYISNLRKE